MCVISVKQKFYFYFYFVGLPYTFNEMHKDTICNSVTLIVEGGVKFVAKYDKDNGRLTNLDKFMSKMHIEWFTTVILTYISESCFFVKCFMLSGIGMPMSSQFGTFLYDMNRLSMSKITNVNKPLLVFTKAYNYLRRVLSYIFRKYLYGQFPFVLFFCLKNYN